MTLKMVFFWFADWHLLQSEHVAFLPRIFQKCNVLVLYGSCRARLSVDRRFVQAVCSQYITNYIWLLMVATFICLSPVVVIPQTRSNLYLFVSIGPLSFTLWLLYWCGGAHCSCHILLCPKSIFLFFKTCLNSYLGQFILLIFDRTFLQLLFRAKADDGKLNVRQLYSNGVDGTTNTIEVGHDVVGDNVGRLSLMEGMDLEIHASNKLEAQKLSGDVWPLTSCRFEIWGPKKNRNNKSRWKGLL